MCGLPEQDSRSDSTRTTSVGRSLLLLASKSASWRLQRPQLASAPSLGQSYLSKPGHETFTTICKTYTSGRLGTLQRVPVPEQGIESLRPRHLLLWEDQDTRHL